jgi:hypothetical protein
VVYLQAREVCEGDDFDVFYDPELTLRHRPKFGADRGRVTHVYCVAKLTSGDRLIEVLTAEEVEGIHQRSEGAIAAKKWNKAESGPWATDWLEMGKKTALRRMCKRLPRSTSPATAAAFAQLAEAIEQDNRQYTEATAIEPPKPQNGSGYAKGQYASPEQTQAYLDGLKAWIAVKNAAWADGWTDRETGEVREGIKDLLNVHQCDGHLLKFCVETGKLDAAIVPEEAKVRQLGRYVAIVYHRSTADRKAIGKEMEAYAAVQVQRATEAYYCKHPELAEPEDAPRGPTVGPEDDSQDQDGDPDVEMPEGY